MKETTEERQKRLEKESEYRRTNKPWILSQTEIDMINREIEFLKQLEKQNNVTENSVPNK